MFNFPSLKTLHLMLAIFFGVMTSQPSLANEEGTPLTTEQLLLMMFVDQGRTVGYQRLLASIQLDTIKAELERDHAILEQTQKLYDKNAIPLIDLEIAQLKDAWNRKQLIVAEKNADAIAAQFSAITLITEKFMGGSVTVEEVYAAYRRGWDAGCDKGPDEVIAMEAWEAFARKSMQRAQLLNSRGSLPPNALMEREAQVKIASSNAQSRKGRLDRCRAVLFPSLSDVMAVAE